ncbi:hypothetical protein HOE67_04930 [Candidatus Peregrinibacteria bacterium]|jgi:hypothetical protein|nr:hypothetical protein [Candidatus Peregrinibacteria bacterium]MBT4056425.1 hypothetical protein [Candidatus Peregrinibacteria bacterium]
MFATSTDVMHMAFALGFVVIAIFLSLALMYLVFVLRDVAKILGNVRDVVDGVKSSIASPLKAFMAMGDKLGPFLEEHIKKAKKKMKK